MEKVFFFFFSHSMVEINKKGSFSRKNIIARKINDSKVCLLVSHFRGVCFLFPFFFGTLSSFTIPLKPPPPHPLFVELLSLSHIPATFGPLFFPIKKKNCFPLFPPPTTVTQHPLAGQRIRNYDPLFPTNVSQFLHTFFCPRRKRG